MSVFSAVLTMSITFPKQNGTAIVTLDDTSKNATAFMRVHFSGAASRSKLFNSDFFFAFAERATDVEASDPTASAV